MKRQFFISDTHFGHANIVKFKRADNTPLRDFPSAQEMDEHIIENWNRTVSPTDTVCHLGDVVINRKHLPTLSRLNGRKVLIKGNHDIFPLYDYTKYFADIRAYRVFPEHGIIASHIPIHPGQLISRWKLNIHGHLHSNTLPDPKYLNVSCEEISYTPISLEEVLEKYLPV